MSETIIPLFYIMGYCLQASDNKSQFNQRNVEKVKGCEYFRKALQLVAAVVFPGQKSSVMTMSVNTYSTTHPE